jgi:hypothetical protein
VCFLENLIIKKPVNNHALLKENTRYSLQI